MTENKPLADRLGQIVFRLETGLNTLRRRMLMPSDVFVAIQADLEALKALKDELSPVRGTDDNFAMRRRIGVEAPLDNVAERFPNVGPRFHEVVLTQQLVTWMADNHIDDQTWAWRAKTDKGVFVFEMERDATLFRLRWTG